ncbi:hypothetical protein GCM10027062_40550 [Nocardioides hungaricus]
MCWQSDPEVHPVVAFAAHVRAAAKDVADVEPTFMSPAEKAEALRELARVEAQVAGLRMQVMAVAGDVAEQHGARDVAAWLAAETRTEYRSVRSDQELAAGLERHGLVASALLAGDISPAHARSIVAALEVLPRGLDVDVAASAETALVGYAGEFRPAQLTRLGRRILEIVAPEVADEEEARRLRAEEQRATSRLRVSFRPLGDGMTRIVLDVQESIAARFKTYLDAYTSPRRSEPAPGDRVPYGRRMAEAFGSLLEHLDPQRLPDHGGDATTVLVTIGLDQLRADLAAAGLIDGDLSGGSNLTADEARRLACTAHLVPVVLGGDSEILDLGRSRRLFSAAQRKAMRLRDRECRAEGCTVPATWCEAHHLRGWAVGGRTDLADGVLLCSHHHHRAHDSTCEMQRLPSGDYRFHRRT